MIRQKIYNEKSDLARRWDGLDLDLLPIDSLDVSILDILRDNSRTSNAEIARMLKTSEATIRRRIKAMIDKQIIAGFSTYINYALIENPVKAYIHLKVRTERMGSVVEKIKSHDMLLALYRVAGEYDLLCVTLFSTMDGLHEFIDYFLGIDGIIETNTQIVMKAHKGVPWTGI
ncbi:MAG: Lrp/AsnC family transcriptional regulator [Methanomassiliicoccales archaeon]|nr:MAG: Lrp/AsnC family transcriptional regulator [Methanomassiliicoccales archaeon]